MNAYVEPMVKVLDKEARFFDELGVLPCQLANTASPRECKLRTYGWSTRRCIQRSHGVEPDDRFPLKLGGCQLGPPPCNVRVNTFESQL